VTSPVEAVAFERCMSVGGVALFPSDTVYGLACDAHSRVAVERLYRLKRRPLDKPSAVMFFELSLAFDALPELGPRTRAALERMLPGAVTVLLPNPELRFPLACGGDQLTLGLRVPVVPGLAGVRWPVVQSSANLAGGPEARELGEVPTAIQGAADMLIDGGRLPGTASTVIDLRDYENSNQWRVVRPGAVTEEQVALALAGQFHFDPSGYGEMIRADIPVYERFQAEVAQASGAGARRVLELGTGTGETALALLERHPEAELVGLDESAAMLGAARLRLPADRVSLHVGRLEEPLPEGPFDLVASALCVHHLDGEDKRELFARVARVLRPGGRFVLGDVIVPEDAADAVTSLTPDFDRPSLLVDQLRWLDEAGFAARVVWLHGDLAVISAELARD
jgi:tRNA threonylcarbamoyl adenosine modification protein (Sua5/YciO/YrdC/YwlC family)